MQPGRRACNMLWLKNTGFPDSSLQPLKCAACPQQNCHLIRNTALHLVNCSNFALIFSKKVTFNNISHFSVKRGVHVWGKWWAWAWRRSGCHTPEGLLNLISSCFHGGMRLSRPRWGQDHPCSRCHHGLVQDALLPLVILIASTKETRLCGGRIVESWKD